MDGNIFFEPVVELFVTHSKPVQDIREIMILAELGLAGGNQ